MTKTFGADFNKLNIVFIMNEKDFFTNYIPALDKALSYDNINDEFSVKSPNWYIKDQKLRNQMDLFEDKNFNKYKKLFDSVSIYFDAKSHGFEKVENIEIDKYKTIILDEMNKYRNP